MRRLHLARAARWTDETRETVAFMEAAELSNPVAARPSR